MVDLETDLERYVREMDALSSDMVATCRESAERENAYRMAKARAFLKATGTVDARKAEVDIVCEKERLDAHIADALREANIQRLNALKAILSAFQTVASTRRAEMQLAGVPEPSAPRLRPESQVEAWNSVFPEGTEVVVTKDSGETVKTTTRSVAWVAGNTPVVQVRGISSYCPLSRVRPVGIGGEAP